MPLLPSQTTLVYRKPQNGFTLIEIMIVIAIIGILAAIAYPAYSSFVTDSRRSDGHLAILEASQRMERCKATSYSYLNCTLTSATSPELYYAMTLATTATTYTITATGVNAQATDTDCNVMTLNQQGVRTPAQSVGCWPN